MYSQLSHDDVDGIIDFTTLGRARGIGGGGGVGGGSGK